MYFCHLDGKNNTHLCNMQIIVCLIAIRPFFLVLDLIL